MNERHRPIEGVVVRILNMHQIVLNVGTNKGVTKGMLFDVMDPSSQELRDPVNGDVLGNLDDRKKRVQVTRTHEKFSVATTLSKRVNKGGQGGFGLGARLADELTRMNSLTRIYEEPRWVTTRETLATSDAGYTYDPKAEKKSVVKVKDPVIQVLSDSQAKTADVATASQREVAASAS